MPQRNYTPLYNTLCAVTVLLHTLLPAVVYKRLIYGLKTGHTQEIIYAATALFSVVQYV